jgi:hypothetical protein
MMVITLVLITGVIIGLAVHHSLGGSNSPLSETIKSHASFPLYYPKDLPQGYVLHQQAYDTENSVVSFDLINQGREIYFSEQALPRRFDFASFHNNQMTGTSKLNTPVGPAYIGIINKQDVASVETPKTWVLITAGNGVGLVELQAISQSLQQIKH